MYYILCANSMVCYPYNWLSKRWVILTEHVAQCTFFIDFNFDLQNLVRIWSYFLWLLYTNKKKNFELQISLNFWLWNWDIAMYVSSTSAPFLYVVQADNANCGHWISICNVLVVQLLYYSTTVLQWYSTTVLQLLLIGRIHRCCFFSMQYRCI